MLLQLSSYCSTTYWVCDLALGPGQITGETHYISSGFYLFCHRTKVLLGLLAQLIRYVVP